MGRRKGRKEVAETLKSRIDESLSANIVEGEAEAKGKGKFFACYLLTSLSPRFKGHTYIGFTVNPRRRIRQHNGEITSGAWRTKKRRPWEMVLCIYGFPTNVAALQFEWAWQHPVESLAVRQAAVAFKSLSGLANKIKLAHTMLTLPPWQSLNLTVNYFSTKYVKHAAGGPRLPEHMRVQVCTMDELPCYTEGSFCADENDELHSADDDCEQKGGSQESVENQSVEAQKINDDVQDAIEGCTNGTVLERMEISGLYERLSKGSSQHDPNLDEEPPFSFSSCNKMVTNAEDVGIMGVLAPLLSVPSCKKVITIAEDAEVLCCSDDSMRHRKNEVHKQQSCSVSSCNEVAAIDEHKERIFRLLDECIDEPDQVEHHGQTREKTVSEKVQRANIPSDVEVVDVFTPSPCFNGSKKRRRSENEIIDLTISPLYV